MRDAVCFGRELLVDEDGVHGYPLLGHHERTESGKMKKGSAQVKHHQWLTEDIGHPALAQHLYATVGFMRGATSWDQFYRMMQRAFPKLNTTMLSPMPDVDDNQARV